MDMLWAHNVHLVYDIHIYHSYLQEKSKPYKVAAAVKQVFH